MKVSKYELKQSYKNVSKLCLFFSQCIFYQNLLFILRKWIWELWYVKIMKMVNMVTIIKMMSCWQFLKWWRWWKFWIRLALSPTVSTNECLGGGETYSRLSNFRNRAEYREHFATLMPNTPLRYARAKIGQFSELLLKRAFRCARTQKKQLHYSRG